MPFKNLITILFAISTSLIFCNKNTNVTDTGTPGTDDGDYTNAQMAQLSALMDQIDPKLDSLAKTITTPIMSPLVVEAVLKTIPGVHIANEGDTTGNALYVQADTKGPFYAVLWRTQPPPSDTVTPLLDSAALADQSFPLAKSNGVKLPHGKEVYLFSALDGKGYPNWVPQLKPVFQRVPTNYNVKYLDASTANLRTVSNASVLVFYGHGLPAFGGTYYLMSTTTLESSMSAADNADVRTSCLMAANLKMATVSWYHALTTAEDGKYARVLCITPKFISKYWSFAENSIVIFDACWSASFGAISLKQVMLDKKVSTTAGWSRQGDPSTVAKATCVLIDRMLGANVVAPVQKPYQRPFDRDAILPVLQDLGCARSLDGLSWSDIVFEPSGTSNACGILAPSIKRLLVDEMRKELIIQGIFGEDQTKGKVTIAGNERTISAWSGTEIKCELKDDDCGLVRVEYADHRSNPVNLTMWKLKLTFTATGPMSLLQKFDIYCPWRADLHAYREKPDGELTREPLDILPTHGAHVEYQASGIATSDDGSMSYNGSGTTPSPYEVTGNLGTLWTRFDPQDSTRLKVYEKIQIMSGITITGKNSEGSDTRPLPVMIYKDMINTDDVFVDMINFNGVKMGTIRLVKDFELDEKYGIKAGQIGPFSLETDLGPVVYLLKWDACAATAGPVEEWGH
jgi:hypothetical protein